MNYQLQLIHSWIAIVRWNCIVKQPCVSYVVHPRHCRHSGSVEWPDIVINDMTCRPQFLVLIFDNRLTWTSHASNICKEMSYYHHLVGLHKRVLLVGLIKLLMDSLEFFCIMQYALPVWGPSLYHQYLQCLQKLQNHAVCLIFSLNKFDHVSKHYEQLRAMA